MKATQFISEAHLEVGAETQVFALEMEKNAVETQKKIQKRKSCMSKHREIQKKKILEEPKEESFLGQLELLWENHMLENVLSAIILSEDQAKQQKKLQLKRIFTQMNLVWKQTMNLILHQLENKERSKTFSWTDFTDALRESALYTTLYQLTMSTEAIKIFQTQYAGITNLTEVPSSGFVNTEKTTFTSSTIVPIQVPLVAVQGSSTYEEEKSALGALFEF